MLSPPLSEASASASALGGSVLALLVSAQVSQNSRVASVTSVVRLSFFLARSTAPRASDATAAACAGVVGSIGWMSVAVSTTSTSAVESCTGLVSAVS